MSAVVVDTNVGMVANGVAAQASSECRLNAVRALRTITREGGLVVDRAGLIFGEYRARLSLAGQPGVGDAFVRWVHDHQWDESWCTRVRITPDPDRAGNFLEFPSTVDLEDFDDSDRKFVAAAIAHGGDPPILQALDAGWWRFRHPLAASGVTVEFICEEIAHLRRAANG